MTERTQSANATVTKHELSEIRGLIQGRSGAVFENSQEHCFAARIGEHMAGGKFEVSNHSHCILYRKSIAPKPGRSAHTATDLHKKAEREKKA